MNIRDMRYEILLILVLVVYSARIYLHLRNKKVKEKLYNPAIVAQKNHIRDALAELDKDIAILERKAKLLESHASPEELSGEDTQDIVEWTKHSPRWREIKIARRHLLILNGYKRDLLLQLSKL